MMVLGFLRWVYEEERGEVNGNGMVVMEGRRVSCPDKIRDL